MIRHRSAMIRHVHPKPILSGKLARRMGQTTDPTDEPVLITPLSHQLDHPIDEVLTKQGLGGDKTIDREHP
jgi:hypothetical protein